MKCSETEWSNGSTVLGLAVGHVKGSLSCDYMIYHVLPGGWLDSLPKSKTVLRILVAQSLISAGADISHWVAKGLLHLCQSFGGDATLQNVSKASKDGDVVFTRSWPFLSAHLARAVHVPCCAKSFRLQFLYLNSTLL